MENDCDKWRGAGNQIDQAQEGEQGNRPKQFHDVSTRILTQLFATRHKTHNRGRANYNVFVLIPKSQAVRAIDCSKPFAFQVILNVCPV